MMIKTLPPDGGWGWVIVLATSLNNLLIIPMISLFGMLFGDKLYDIGLSTAQISVITNTNIAFGLLLGLFIGAFIKKFGYRKVAFMSAIFLVLGFLLTAFASSFVSFLLFYGILFSTGLGMAKSAYTYALNVYFLKNRSQAIAVAYSLTMLGPILFPQIVTILLENYDLQGTIIIISAIISHVFLSACLLQPIKIHLKIEQTEELEMLKVTDKDPKIIISTNETYWKKSEKYYSSTLSLDDLNSQLIRINEETQTQIQSNESNFKLKVCEADEVNSKNQSKHKMIKCFTQLFDLFELSLLADPIFINIVMGLSFALFADLNFGILLALMLKDFGLKKGQIATFMSVQSISELIFRFLSPYVGGPLKKHTRILFMISLCFLAMSRFFFLAYNNFSSLLISAGLIGMFRGLRTIYMKLIVPEYVPIQKLSGALGIEMVLNGLFFLIGGPFLGFIKDISGSYKQCIVIMNILTLLPVFMWSTEMVIIKLRSRETTKTISSQNI